MPDAALISCLSRSLLAGELIIEGALARAQRTLGRPWPWLPPLAQRFVDHLGGRKTRPRHREAVRFLLHDGPFREARLLHGKNLTIAEWIPEPFRMQPAPAARLWNLPAIECSADLADALSLTPSELDWFSGVTASSRRTGDGPLHHYHYRLLAKRSGGVRLIESPKPNLKSVQRRVHSGILKQVPAHPAAHGFVEGRSIVTFASPDTGKALVLRMDLRHFFPAFPAARVQALFRTLGYPEPVADRLAGLCSHALPLSVWHTFPRETFGADWHEAQIAYSRPHLPQGAPTSPALANLMAFRLDCRLSGLARSAGSIYTRYADDLAFSGDRAFCHAANTFSLHIAAIALEEGFAVNHHKTRFLRQGVRQSLAGTVVNCGLHVRRDRLKLLEAILTNCARHGFASQNRANMPNFREHLAGRIAYVHMIDPRRGQRLRALFDEISP